MTDAYNPFDVPAEQGGIHGPASTGYEAASGDMLVAAPTSFGQQIVQGEFAAQQAAGMTSLTKHDADMALMHAENAVKTAMANGATREEAIAAAGHYANGNPELAAIVNEAAGKQYDANKNPFETAPGQANTAEHTYGTLHEMLGLGVTAEAVKETNKEGFGKLVLDDHERNFDENGKVLSTTAAIAALEQFRPQAGLPIPQRQQGRGIA